MRKQVIDYEVTCDKCGSYAGQGTRKINQYSFSFGAINGRADLCLECSWTIDHVITFFSNLLGIIITKKQIEGTEVTGDEDNS